MTGTDLDVVDPTASAVATVGEREFGTIQRQADTLSRSDIIPKAYRGRPANIIAAALVGRQYGWDPMTSMRYGHVVEGNYDVKPEAMLGLIRRAGHSVRFEEHRSDNIAKCGVTAHGKRHDTGDEDSASFLISDAVRARLCRITDDGKIRARSKQDNPLPWEQYPLDMCQWRAVGRLVRRLFSDIGVGIYTATEFTELVDDDGVEIINAGPVEHAPAPDAVASPLSDAAIASFRDACANPKAGDPVDPDDVLAKAFPDGVPDQLTDHHLPAMQAAFLALVNEGLEAAAKGDTPPAPTEQPTPPPESAVPADDDRPATRGQVGKIKAQYARFGIDERDDQMPLTGEFIGREVTSHNKLTRTEALRVHDWLSHAKTIDDLGDALVVDAEIVEPGD